MHILQIGKFHWHQSGGIESHIRNLAFELSQTGHQVTCGFYSPSKNYSVSLKDNIEIHSIPIKFQINSLPVGLGFKSLVNRTEPDLVHLHLPNPVALAELSKIQIPLVITYHSDLKKNWLLDQIYHQTQNHFLKSVNGAIFTSEYLMKSHKVQWPKKVFKTVIPPCVKVHRSSENLVTEKDIDYLFVGRLVPYKGLSFLLKAMQQVKGQLYIVGDGPLRDSLKKLAKRLKVNHKVFFEGQKSPAQLEKYFQRAEINVLPSISSAEAFGMAVLEGFHHGIPAVTSDLSSGLKELNVHKKTGLRVPPRDSNQLAKALTTLNENFKLRSQLGLNAKEYADKFHHKKVLDKHLQFYREVTAQ